MISQPSPGPGLCTHHTHLHGPHQLFCWSSPKRARHFLGALRSDAATGKREKEAETREAEHNQNVKRPEVKRRVE